MNQIIENVYTVFKRQLEKYNRQRSEKIELAYVGECQNFYVFAGDWQNLFLINDNGGFEIYFKTNEPKNVEDIEVSSDLNYYTKAMMSFNYKRFIKWLYKRNTLVKQINWTNLKTIKHIQTCNSKITPFEANLEIDNQTGKICGIGVFSISTVGTYFVETFNYEDKPHCIIKDENERYRFYLPDKKPKTQKEMKIVPDFPFSEELYNEKIKNIKHYAMPFISGKREGEKHSRYYEALLLYRAFNPNIEVKKIENKDEAIKTAKLKNIKIWSFCDFAVKEYAQRHNLNPFNILSEMYNKGYINHETGIIGNREDFIKEYSYLCETNEGNL